MNFHKFLINQSKNIFSWAARQSYVNQYSRGVALLLTVFILTAVLSISIGVFTVLYGEILIIGAVEDSFLAINASDHGVERTVYRDRNVASLPNGAVENVTLNSGACYEMTTVKSGLITQIRVVGEYVCNNPTRGVRRAFRVTY